MSALTARIQDLDTDPLQILRLELELGFLGQAVVPLKHSWKSIHELLDCVHPLDFYQIQIFKSVEHLFIIPSATKNNKFVDNLPVSCVFKDQDLPGTNVRRFCH